MHLSTANDAVSSGDRNALPFHRATFGNRFVGLSGSAGDEGLIHKAELLSPYLAGLEPGETLSLEVAFDPARGWAIGMSGAALGYSAEKAGSRAAYLARFLSASLAAQAPGLSFQPEMPFAARNSADWMITPILPRGHLAVSRYQAKDIGPQAVTPPMEGVILPPVDLTPERMASTMDLIRAVGEPASLVLSLRRVEFDAHQLRRLKEARHSVLNVEPQNRVEALRHITETLSDDKIMTALLEAGYGVELTLSLATLDRPERSLMRTICHAVFDAELSGPTSITAGALNLTSIYPAGYVCSRVVAMLAAGGLVSQRREAQTYVPPLAEGILLGHTPSSDPVRIGERDRARHTYVIGAIGTGKSTLLLNMIQADMQAGNAVVLVDPHGDLWQDARALVPDHRKQDLLLGHLGDPEQFPIAMNMLQGLGGDPAVERPAIIGELLRLFKRTLWSGVDAFGPIFEQYFRNALMLLMQAHGDEASVLDVERLFFDREFRKSLIEKCEAGHVNDFWNEIGTKTSGDWDFDNFTVYVTSKLSPFTSNTLLRPVLGAKTSNIDFPDIIRNGRIVLLNLAKGTVGEDGARLLGGMICSRLVASAQRQLKNLPADRKQVTVYLDEFQTYATENLSEAIEECRKFGVRLVFANQSLGQINGSRHRPDVGHSIIANVANLISFRLGVADAEVLANWFRPRLSAEDLMYLPDYTAAARLLVSGKPMRPVMFKTLPPTSRGGC